jgi:ribosomal-protein-serine acetyltransferase
VIAHVPTDVPGLELRTLVPNDASPYLAALQANASHLTKLGDYVDEVRIGLDELAVALAVPDLMRFGVWLDDALIGCVHVVPVNPPSFGFGYWIAAAHEGRGLMFAACRAALDFARRELCAVEVFAGVTHDNERSVRLLHRLGFEEIVDFDRYTRFRLGLA